MATVVGLFRYPVKSMLGGPVDAVSISTAGVVGDRAYAVVDTTDGTVASAKQPRKWGRLLELQAAFVDEPTSGEPPPPVAVTFPDGSVVTNDSGELDSALSDFLARPVRLVSTPPADATFEEVWPDIDGLAPAEFIESTSSGQEPTGESVSSISLSMAAPPGTFFDVAPLHLLTTATLAALAAAAPEAQFDVRRYRPNVLIETDEAGFVENGWTGGTAIGMGAEASAVTMIPTMRCVMTTLPQGPGAGGDALGQDRSTLRAVAAHNRIEIPGMGEWACAGIYAAVAAGGTVRVGDPVTV